MQNAQVGMTKQQYFDLCEQMGSEPIEEEIPVDIDDFPLEAQHALSIYKVLRDEWEFMAGNYLGKNINGIFEVFSAYDVDIRDRRFYLELIHVIDSIRIQEIQKQKQQEKPAK